jgi:hypothetical protein
MTDFAHTPAVERIARVLAGMAISANGHGADPSAGEIVDATWTSYRSDAVAVLKTLREPDPVVAQAGHGDTWTRMIDALLNSNDR